MDLKKKPKPAKIFATDTVFFILFIFFSAHTHNNCKRICIKNRVLLNLQKLRIILKQGD